LFSFQYFISNLNPGHRNGCGKFLFFLGKFESFWGFNIEGLDQEAVLDQGEDLDPEETMDQVKAFHEGSWG